MEYSVKSTFLCWGLLILHHLCHSVPAGGVHPLECCRQKNYIYFFPLQNKETYEPLCKVPLMTSSKEEQKLIATSNKVGDVVFYIMCQL